METKVRQDAILERKICLKDEREFYVQSNDFFRPDLKQMKSSISDTRDYFTSKEFIPATLMLKEFKELRDRLKEVQQSDLLSGFIPSSVDGNKMLAFMSHSLSISLNFHAHPKPKGVKCDIIIFYTNNPAMLLTVTQGCTNDNENAQIYNTSVLKGLNACLSKFIDVSFQPIFGVLDMDDIEEKERFTSCIRTFVDLSRKLVSYDTLSMNQTKYEKIMYGFWASVSECKSIYREKTDNEREFLRFLTTDQCKAFVENINSQRVNVMCRPGSGATTLMVDVAQRLSRQGETLLVLQSEKDILTHCSPSLEFKTICMSELTQTNLSQFDHLVCDNFEMKQSQDGTLWTFYTVACDTSNPPAAYYKKDQDGDSGELKTELIIKEGGHDFPETSDDLSGMDPRDKDVYIKTLKDQISALTDKLKRKEEVKADPEKYSVLQTHQVHQWHLKEEKDKRDCRGAAKLLPQTEDRLKQELKPEWSSVKHLPQMEEMVKQELNPERSSTKHLPQAEEMLEQECKPEWSSVKLLHQTEEGLKQEYKPEWSLQKVKIKQEPTEIPTDYGSEKIHQQDQVDVPKRGTSDTGGETSPSRDNDYICPLCSVTCTSENNIKQHFFLKHLAAEESAPPLHHADTDTDVAVAGPSHRPDSFPVASSNIAVASPSHRPDSFPVASSDVAEASPDSPIPICPHGMKRVKVTYLECLQCPKRFKTERGCKRHMRAVHPEPALSPSFDESGDPFYLVGEPDAQCQVSCPSMTLDSDRVYRELHVSEDGLELENTKSRGDSGGFMKFKGTCSRLPIPLPPSPSTLTTPRYWETRTRVWVGREVSLRTLLEMGVCGEGEVNTKWFVSLQPRDSWTVLVEDCIRHNGICTKVWSEGRQVGECRTNTMSDTLGTTQDLNYGVVLDVGRGVVAFLDLDREVVLSSLNVQFRESLRPIFGVCTDPSHCTVKMRLVSGGEITMTNTKKHLIYQALSTT